MLGIGFLLGAVALLSPKWSTTWTDQGASSFFGVLPAWAALHLMAVTLGLFGIWRMPVLVWIGAAGLALSTLVPNAIQPLLQSVGTTSTPNYGPELGYWLSVIALFVVLFGLFSARDVWLRLAVIGLGLCALSLVTYEWAILVGTSLVIHPIRVFDRPNGTWASAWFGAAALLTLGMSYRIVGPYVRVPFALRAAATSVTWIGVVAGAVAVLWGLGFDRIAHKLELGAGFLANAEGFWLATIGLAVVVVGLVLEVTTAETPQAGRWTMLSRIIAPSHPSNR